MRGPAQAGATDEVPRMQEGVRDWVRQTTRHAGNGQNAASPAALLSLLCASAFRPLLMPSGAAAADIAVLSRGDGRALAGAVTDTLDDLRSEIASVLQQIDAGGTALRAAMEEPGERARADVIGAIGVISSGFGELEFLLTDAAKAAEEMQERLDVEGANARAAIERNERQSTDVRLVREDLAVKAGADGRPAAAPDDRAVRWADRCPYRGLLLFDETDAEVFCGRERLAAELAVQLAARATRGGLVVVTGASGAGKSSLLRAGLLPILARGEQIPGSDRWPRIVMTPTKDPLTELAAQLAAIGGPDALAVRDSLARHPDQAHLAIRSAVLAAARSDEEPPAPADDAARLVLIVDQFDQVFTLNPDLSGEATRQAFITALCAAAA